jgi:hypothetical protein
LTTAARPADHRARVSRSGLSAAWFGKWHLAGFKEAQGRAALRITSESQRGGFDAWVGYEDNNSQWDKWVHGGTGKDAFQYRLPGYESEELINLFIRYLRERGAEARAGKPRPFFAALSVRARATPTWPRPEFMSRYNGPRLELRPNVPPVARIQEAASRDLAGFSSRTAGTEEKARRERLARQSFPIPPSDTARIATCSAVTFSTCVEAADTLPARVA